MPSRVKRVGSAFSALLLTVFFTFAAGAEVGDVDDADRWVPAVVFSSGILIQDAGASIDTSDVIGRSFPNPNPLQPIRPPTSGDVVMITPDVGVSVEFVTPRVAAEWWAPSFFVHGGIGGAFGPRQDVASEGSIDTLTVDDDFVRIRDSDLTGQGSRVRVRTDRLLVRGGAGLSFSADVLERRVRIRTSLEYLREEVEAEALVRRAVCIARLAGFPPTCGAKGINHEGNGVDDFRAINLGDVATKSFHGIGPGLELEMDAGRIGPVVPSIGVGARVYRFLGSRKISLSDVNEFGETMHATFEKEAWAYSVGTTVRLRWLPE